MTDARLEILFALAAETQRLTDPDALMTTSARMLAEHLEVDRCAYAEIEDEDLFVITGDYTRGVPSIVGRWPIAAFGAECERCMRENVPYVIDDVDTDPRAGAELLAYRQTMIQAVICVPLHKGGRLTAAMAVHQKTARHWRTSEIELVLTVVERCWESLERARVTRGLEETASRLELTLEAAKLGDWTWEPGDDMVTFSSRAAEIFGIPPGRHTTWTRMQAMLHDDDRDVTARAVERAVAERSQYDVTYRVRRPTGDEVWVSAKGRAHYDAAGTAISMYGVVQDVTEGKRLQQELERRAAELAEADRKKDDFIALLAHELRNPLAPVRTALQVMRLAAGDAVAIERARAIMDRQLGHMVRLIDDLLDASRIGRNKLFLQRGRVVLADAVGHAVEASAPAIEAGGHELEVRLPSSPVVLDADLTRLAQIFGNLLSNSARYTERGGRIRLVAEREGVEVVVRVEDNGIGIPADALPRVFDMFAQLDRRQEKAGGGLGIGLALVRGLVEGHGGTVVARSEGVGRGSVFEVRLPVMAEDRREAEGEPTMAAATRKRVLVADDSADGAELMGELLHLLGHEAHIVHDGDEAVAAAERLRPDLILMDIGMPRMDGLEATRRIRAEPWGAAIRIVALTGWGQDADRERSRQAGCNGHLVKPVSRALLLDALAAV
jgi:PAS domain S-box-containing protein